ncbi:MAG: 4-(cytidine 5'-diphospho)-2-C-methyl-D-erythritol kinase [Actinomycetota bacterium]
MTGRPSPSDRDPTRPGATVVVDAPAKLTLSLRLLDEVRPDGLHAIEAEMVALDFGDELTIGPAGPAGTSVSYHGLPVPPGPGGDDLVTRALALVDRTAEVSVHKRIPAGAGLGGGSSDAAAILRWAGFTDHERAAREIGADVAFCLVGGRAMVGGMGERVEPVPFRPLVVTLATPPVHCATAEVYRMWDRLGGPTGDGGNDLEPAALAVAPELRRWRDELAAATGAVPRLAGSGSTWFVTGEHPGPGRIVARAIPPEPG